MINLLKNKRLIRYFGVALFIVVLEFITFQVIFLMTYDYIAATVLSFFFAVVLNWILSRKVVFGASNHKPSKEFMLVLVASVVGVVIQIGVVHICVVLLHLYPLAGKILSTAFSFFWNYWFRARFIFKKKAATIENIEGF